MTKKESQKRTLTQIAYIIGAIIILCMFQKSCSYDSDSSYETIFRN